LWRKIEAYKQQAELDAVYARIAKRDAEVLANGGADQRRVPKVKPKAKR
jgi:hypothetical protein